MTVRAKPYGGCAEIVQKSCNAIAVAMQSLQIPQGNSRALMQAPYRGCEEMVVTVRGLYDCPKSLRSLYKFVWPT